VLLPDGVAVLNAQDDAVAALADYCDGEVIFYAASETNPHLVKHRATDGRVAFWRKGHLILAHGTHETDVLNRQLPAIDKFFRDQILTCDELLAAAATAWALGVPADLIRAGTKSFGRSPASH
jgi:cyanophycin synthetase